MPLTRLVMVEAQVVRNGDVVEMRAQKWSGFMRNEGQKLNEY